MEENLIYVQLASEVEGAPGMTRKLDSLGRFVVPKEIRRRLHVDENTALEVFVDDKHIILRKFAVEDSLIETIRDLENTVRENYLHEGVRPKRRECFTEVAALLEEARAKIEEATRV